MTDDIIPIGKYMYASLQPRIQERKTDRWKIVSSTKAEGKLILGTVSWYFLWRQYTFNPEVDTTFNAECLEELSSFLKDVNKKHRAMKES